MRSGGEEKEKLQKFFDSSKKPVIIEGSAKHGDELDPSGCSELGGGKKRKKSSKIFSELQKI
ncbi:hypothetical protein WKW77_32585, partial [Variovorax ureilyticus]